MDAIARSLAGPAGTRLGRWLARGDHLLGGLRPLLGPSPTIITEVHGAEVEAARAGFGDGPATAEAVVVRLRRRGVAVTAAPGGSTVRGRRGLVSACRDRGRDSVRVLRSAPDLLPELQIGSWFNGGWRTRLVRRVALGAPAAAGWLPARVAADAAFWAGVRDAATATEWRRLTASSYVVLCYHRIAGAARPGEERMDVAPAALRRQLRLLCRLGWRPLTVAEIVAFHRDPGAQLPRRRFVLTADDGFRDAVTQLAANAAVHPQIFAVTRSVGDRAGWLGDAPLAGWDELQALCAAGGTVGSHARRHVRLDEQDDAAIEQELAGSLADLRARLAEPAAVLAYPHGGHDARVRDAARQAGYTLAYTTRQGRNGAGTDRWCLRRVEPKAWDSTLSFVWKVLTAESPPPRWERRLERRWRGH
ncbi:MAG TPA: polysaccharide deacetylase family protein [Jatrophihabitans sp.]|nr:polysaccharide deacetylase family protein [Jatrophihabitans sp.]